MTIWKFLTYIIYEGGLFGLTLASAPLTITMSGTPLDTAPDAKSIRDVDFDPEAGAVVAEKTPPEKVDSDPASIQEQSTSKRKPVAFYFAFLSLVIMVLIVSLDSTALAVAIPVRSHSGLHLGVVCHIALQV